MVEKITSARFRLRPQFTGVRLKFIVIWAAALFGLFLLQQANKSVLTPPGAPLYVYRNTRGPYLGQRLATGEWQVIHGDGEWNPDDTVTEFKPGQAVVWQTDATMIPGVFVSADYDLTCAGRPQGGSDYRSDKGRPRVDGWFTVGLTLPKGMSTGPCQIDRVVTFTAPDGRTTGPVSFRPIKFWVAAS